ncbi:MAG TPA: hypothetical protein VGV38_10675, partial [Pyrinomonadaceae bacterium]|nr:hypothetical protein [Pyrinomonadaceae bacterium]
HEPPYLRLTTVLAPLLFGLPLLMLMRRRKREEDEQAKGERTRAAAAYDACNAGDERAATGARAAVDAPTHAVAALALFASLPFALAFLLSHALPHSIWGSRHLVVAAAPYLILVSVGLARLRPEWLRTALLVALCCWALLNASFLLFRGQRSYVWCAWQPLAQRMNEDARTRDAAQLTNDSQLTHGAAHKVYAFEEAVAYHVWFALSAAREQRFSVEVVKNVPGVAEDPAYFLPRGFAGVGVRDASEAFDEEFFYVAFRANAWRDDRPPLKFLAERGFEAGAPFEIRTHSGTAFVAPVRRDAPESR